VNQVSCVQCCVNHFMAAYVINRLETETSTLTVVDVFLYSEEKLLKLFSQLEPYFAVFRQIIMYWRRKCTDISVSSCERRLFSSKAWALETYLRLLHGKCICIYVSSLCISL
jgi:hypothetical protein